VTQASAMIDGAQLARECRRRFTLPGFWRWVSERPEAERVALQCLLAAAHNAQRTTYPHLRGFEPATRARIAELMHLWGVPHEWNTGMDGAALLSIRGAAIDPQFAAGARSMYDSARWNQQLGGKRTAR